MQRKHTSSIAIMTQLAFSFSVFSGTTETKNNFSFCDGCVCVCACMCGCVFVCVCGGGGTYVACARATSNEKKMPGNHKKQHNQHFK